MILDKKFRGIDVKLGVAMSAMLRAGSDKAAEPLPRGQPEGERLCSIVRWQDHQGETDHCDDVREF